MPVSPERNRWFEISSVVPVTIYLVVHLASYTSALWGNTRFGVPSRALGSILLETCLVWIPLGFHALYGLRLTITALPSQTSERQTALWLRISGVAALIFIGMHSVWLRAPSLRGELEPEDTSQFLAAALSSTVNGIPLIAALHLLGLAAVVGHLGSGLARFATRWEILSPRTSARAATSIAVALFIAGAATIVEFATGSALPRFLH